LGRVRQGAVAGLEIPNQALPPGVLHQLMTGAEAELLHQVGAVRVNRAGAHHQSFRNFLVAVALRHKVQDLLLSGGEPGPLGGVCTGLPEELLNQPSGHGRI